MVNITKIEALIKEKGWSNSYFCSLLHKNPGWISDMRRGKGLPDENTLETIASKLGTTVDYLKDISNIKEQKNKPTTESDELTQRIQLMLKNVPDDQKESIVSILEGALRAKGFLE